MPEPQATPRPWRLKVNRLTVHVKGPNGEYIFEAVPIFRTVDAELAIAAVNAWDDPLALEARIGELNRTKHTGE